MIKVPSDSMILSSNLSTLYQAMTMGLGLHPWTPSRPNCSIHFVCMPSVWQTNLCRCRKWRITVSRTTARTTAEKQVLCHYFCAQLWIHAWGRLSICWCIYSQIAVKRGFVLNVCITSGIAKTICLPQRGQICSLSCTPWTGDREYQNWSPIAKISTVIGVTVTDFHIFITPTDLRTNRLFAIRSGGTVRTVHWEYDSVHQRGDVGWVLWLGKRKVYTDLTLNWLLISAYFIHVETQFDLVQSHLQYSPSISVM